MRYEDPNEAWATRWLKSVYTRATSSRPLAEVEKRCGISVAMQQARKLGVQLTRIVGEEGAVMIVASKIPGGRTR